MRISDWSSDVCSSDLRAATLAEEAGIGVDLHTDETLNPDSLDIVDLARRTADWPAEMTRSAGHCVSLAVQPPDRLARVLDEVAAAGVSIITNPLTNLYLQGRSEEHTSELQSLMRTSYAVFCLKKQNKQNQQTQIH